MPVHLQPIDASLEPIVEEPKLLAHSVIPFADIVMLSFAHQPQSEVHHEQSVVYRYGRHIPRDLRQTFEDTRCPTSHV